MALYTVWVDRGEDDFVTEDDIVEFEDVVEMEESDAEQLRSDLHLAVEEDRIADYLVKPYTPTDTPTIDEWRKDHDFILTGE